MDHLSRFCLAAAVAMAEGQTAGGRTAKSDSGFRTSCSAPPANNVFEDRGTYFSNNEEDNRRNETDESLRQIMYLNCWTQN
ncbi:UNVERIFIED_CONTAM: hypothetical protein Sradi_2210900 [Sesamum radiatum]|uniref:Secreted protein n=1 Tax=Sesamum radiatum TaxID=300843 RepID=A0AAW2T165_SESRA